MDEKMLCHNCQKMVLCAPRSEDMTEQFKNKMISYKRNFAICPDCNNIIVSVAAGRKNRRAKTAAYNRVIDLSERRFGALTAKYMFKDDAFPRNLWHCKCDCGNEIDVPGYLLEKGSVLDCGENCKYHKKSFCCVCGKDLSDLPNSKYRKYCIECKAKVRKEQHRVSALKSWHNKKAKQFANA